VDVTSSGMARDWRGGIGPCVFPPAPATLGAGEVEAIALALQLKADALLMDDRAGRQEERRRGLSVLGTLGVLATAGRRGLTDVPAAVARLRQTNFRASEEMIRNILEQGVKPS